ncbi:MAG TPA: hypothetical protein VGF15_03420, partial [Solirubrobacteraceae bacterium]
MRTGSLAVRCLEGVALRAGCEPAVAVLTPRCLEAPLARDPLLGERELGEAGRELGVLELLRRVGARDRLAAA